MGEENIYAEPQKGLTSNQAGMYGQLAGIGGTALNGLSNKKDAYNDADGISTIATNWNYDQQNVEDYMTNQGFDENYQNHLFQYSESPYAYDAKSGASRLGNSIASGVKKGSKGGMFGALGGAIGGAISGLFANVISKKKDKEFKAAQDQKIDKYYTDRNNFMQGLNQDAMNQAQIDEIYGRANTGNMYNSNGLYDL